jgi:hypothetical protein
VIYRNRNCCCTLWAERWIGKIFPATYRGSYGILGNVVHMYSLYSVPGPQGNGENMLLLHNIIAPKGRLGVPVDVNTRHYFFSAGIKLVVYCWAYISVSM